MRRGDVQVWVLEGGRKGGDPAAVALKGALKDELLRHDYGLRVAEFWSTAT